MKILYAADNRIGSYYQLQRFINSINKKYELKIAAFKSSMQDINADYTLDCLLNFTDKDAAITFDGNYPYYKSEIKKFNPDLIISDAEIYSSVLAKDLKIKLWQYSPINIYYALSDKVKQNIGIHKRYSYLMEANRKKSDFITEIFAYSDRKFVLSHLCDNENKPELVDRFEWTRSAFILGDGKSNYSYTIPLSKSNKKLINIFRNKNAIIFSDFIHEEYDKLIVDDISSNEYIKSLENCRYVISDGTAAFLADAFYNNKYCLSYPRYDDIESIICSYINEYYNLGSIYHTDNIKQINIKIDDNIKFITERIDEVFSN